jgi:integrase
MRSRQGVGRLYRRPRSPYWWAALTVNGAEERRSTECRDRKAAEDWLTTELAKVQTGQYVGVAADKLTVDDLLAELVTKYEVECRPSVRTIRTHQKAWAPVLGTVRAKDVDEATLLRVVTAWKGKYEPATIDKLLGTLRRAYRVAHRAGRIGKVPPFPSLRFFNTREHFCDWPTVLALVDALRALDSALADFTLFGALTGMRKGEISKLEWAGYDAETGVLRLPGRSAKTGKPRRLVLVGPLAEVIARRLEARRPDCPFIFHHRNGHPVVDFRKQWAKACKVVGLVAGKKGLTFHDLRRVGVRNLRRAGVQETVAMAISGHLTTSTFARYNITDDHDLADAMTKVTAYTDELATEKPKVVPLRKRA